MNSISGSTNSNTLSLPSLRHDDTLDLEDYYDDLSSTDSESDHKPQMKHLTFGYKRHQYSQYESV